MATTSFNWNWVRITLLLLLIAAIAVACFTLPVEKTLKEFLLWVENDLGPWGPLALAVAYIPLTILAVPASVLTLGGGYLFGLPMGFLADSIGAVIGATAAFLLGKTIGRSYVISKLGDYPQFQAVAIAIQKSGFKIVLLLRLVPLLPFNMLNYLLSVTPISIWEYMMASWLGMMPITFALVYVGTTLKDLADVTHGWIQFSKTRWVGKVNDLNLCWVFSQDIVFCWILSLTIFNLCWMQALIILSFVVSVILMMVVTKVAKSALEKALAEGIDIDGIVADSSFVVEEACVDIHEPLLVKD